MQQSSRLLLPLTLAALLLTGCGGSKASDSAQASPDSGGVRTIKLTANDAMQFSLTRIEAKAGETLRVAFANTGRIPKQSMAHNWVLLKPATEAELNSFGMAAASAAPTYLPAQSAGLVLAHTKLLGPGEKDTVEFQAPSTPGEYPFLCTFPGHFAMMKGKLIVQ